MKPRIFCVSSSKGTAAIDNYIPLIILLLTIFWVYPIMRMFNAWLIDKTLDGRLALGSLLAHLTILGSLWGLHQYNLLLIYLSVITVLWMAAPAVDQVVETLSMRRLRHEDLLRYQHFLAADPHNAAAHGALGDTYFSLARYEEAIASYEQAIALDPLHSQRESARLLHAREMQERRARRGRRAAIAPPPPPEEPEEADEVLVLPEPTPVEEPPPTEQPRSRDIWDNSIE